MKHSDFRLNRGLRVFYHPIRDELCDFFLLSTYSIKRAGWIYLGVL